MTSFKQILDSFDEKFPSLYKEIEKLHDPGGMHERFIVTGREKIDTLPIKSFLCFAILQALEAVKIGRRGNIDRLGTYHDPLPNEKDEGFNEAVEVQEAKIKKFLE